MKNKNKNKKDVATVEAKKPEVKKPEVKKVIPTVKKTPVVETVVETKTPVEVKTPVIETKTPVEVKTPVETPKSFIERMIAGLTPKQVPGDRTLYVNPAKEIKLEIVEGNKLFNRGVLCEGWLVRTYSGEKGILIKVDEGKAIMKLSSSLEHSISLRSELEILDPEAKETKETKAKVAEVASVDEAGDLKTKKVVEPKKGFASFNGTSYTSKSFLARDIVAKFVSDNPKTTIAKLEEKFPAPFMGKFGLFKEVSEAKAISGNGLPRYFFKPEQLIKIGDKNIAVCNQITTEKIDAIIELAKTNGYEVTK